MDDVDRYFINDIGWCYHADREIHQVLNEHDQLVGRAIRMWGIVCYQMGTIWAASSDDDERKRFFHNSISDKDLEDIGHDGALWRRRMAEAQDYFSKNAVELIETIAEQDDYFAPLYQEWMELRAKRNRIIHDHEHRMGSISLVDGPYLMHMEHGQINDSDIKDIMRRLYNLWFSLESYSRPDVLWGNKRTGNPLRECPWLTERELAA